MRRLIVFAATVAAFSCSLNETPPIQPTTVQFVLEAPLCSSVLPVQLSIDKVIVAVDTFVTYGPPRIESDVFPVTVGPHSISARVVNGFVWPETLITLQQSEQYRHPLPFYCS